MYTEVMKVSQIGAQRLLPHVVELAVGWTVATVAFLYHLDMVVFFLTAGVLWLYTSYVWFNYLRSISEG